MFCALVYIPRKTHMPLHPIKKRCGENDSWNVSKWIRDALARLKGMFRWPPRAIRRQTVKTIRGLRELVNISFLCGDKKLQRVSSSAVSLMKPVKADRIREKKKSDDWQCYGWAVKLSNHFFFLCLFLLIWDKRGRRGGVLTTLKHRYRDALSRSEFPRVYSPLIFHLHWLKVCLFAREVLQLFQYVR